MLTPARLRELLDYDPATGRFTWRNKWRKGMNRSGLIAGSSRNNGRRAIRIDGADYLASRLAMLWITGHWPKQMMDHINGNPGDDRWCNLREVNGWQHNANSKARGQSCPLKGVYFEQRSQRYASQIKKHGHGIWVGYFDTAEEAHAAYRRAARKLFGQFTRLA
jgi:hypothetical protein